MAGEGDGEDDLINRILVACDPEYWATLDKELQATLDKKFQQRGLALLPAMIFLFGTHEINPVGCICGATCAAAFALRRHAV
jgi:hypothetical protein